MQPELSIKQYQTYLDSANVILQSNCHRFTYLFVRAMKEPNAVHRMPFLIANFPAQLYALPNSLHRRLSRSYLDCHQIASDSIACQLPVTYGSLRICTELEDSAIIKPRIYDALPDRWLEQCKYLNPISILHL